MPLLDSKQLLGTLFNFFKQSASPAAKANHIRMFAKNSGGNDADTVAFLRFDEPSGSTTFTDASVLANVVTRTGTAATSNLYQKFGGNSLLLNGASSVRIADNDAFAFAGDWAVDCWIKPAVTNGTTILVNQGINDDNVWRLAVRNNGIRFRFRVGGATLVQLQGGSLSPNNEYFISVSKLGSTYTLKINGAVIATDTNATPIPNYASPIVIGEDVVGGSFYTGHIDELRISKTNRFNGINAVPGIPFDTTILYLKDERGNEYPVQGGFVSTSGGGFWGKVNDALYYDLGSVLVGTNTEIASALLALQSTNKGLLIPRMTEAQKNAIATPATGLLVFQTNNDSGFWGFNGSIWQKLGGTGGGIGGGGGGFVVGQESYLYTFNADLSDYQQGAVFSGGYDINTVDFVSANGGGTPFFRVEYEVNNSGTWIDITSNQTSLTSLVISTTTVIALRVEFSAGQSEGYIRIA